MRYFLFIFFALFFASLKSQPVKTWMSQVGKTYPLPTTDLVAAWSTRSITWLGAGNDEIASFYGDDASRVPRPKSCINFPVASTSYLKFANMEKFALSKAWSVTMWLKPSNATGLEYILSSVRSNTTSGYVLSKSNTSILFMLQNNYTGDYKQCSMGNALSGTLSSAMVQNVWNHLTITYDGSGTTNGVNFYFNGFLCSKNSATGVQMASGSEFAATPDFFYTCQTAAGGSNYEGGLADLRFYDGVLTDTEVRDIYFGSLIISKLLVKLNCEEESGSTLYNAYKTSSNITTYTQAYADATLINSPTWINDNVESFSNLYGYTLSGSVYIPVNIAQSNKDAQGNNATYIGKVKHRIRVGDKVNMSNINFNPYDAPLTMLSYFTHYDGNQQNRYTQVDVPSNYIKGDNTFAFSDISNPYFKIINNSIETKFLIYRKKQFDEYLNSILNYIGYSTPVLLVLGQSNADGSGTLYSDLTAGTYQIEFNNCLALYNNFTSFKVPGITNKVGGQVGPELEQIRVLNDRGDKIYYMLKLSQGTTSLANDASFIDWWPDNTGEKWTDLVNIVNTFKTLMGSRKYHFMYLDWDQGENDRGSGKDLVYAQNFTYFMSKLRMLLNSPNLPVVIRRIYNYGSSATTNVRNQEVLYTTQDPLSDWYDCDDLTLQGDGVHLTSGSQITSGARCIQKAIDRGWVH